MSAKNKSFMQDLESSPAMRFISQPQTRPAEPTTATEPQQDKTHQSQAESPQSPQESPQGQIIQRFVYPEKKSQRAQIVMQPSVISRAKAAAESENISFNEFIHRAIIEKLDREGK